MIEDFLTRLVARRTVLKTLVASSAALPMRAFACDDLPYLGSETLDLSALLVPPSADASDVTRAELAEVKALQGSVAEARIQQAIAGAAEGFKPFVSTTSLAKLDPAQLPLTVALVQRILCAQDAVTTPAKKFFHRPRPPLVDASIKPLVELPLSGSYPSGHATNAKAIAIILSELVPEKRAELMARAYDYATSRLIVGVHYRSDLTAGFVAGALVAMKLQENRSFRADMNSAKVELRAVLSLRD